MSDRRFSQDHEWLAVDGDTATVGITDYAQNALGDVVYVELPEVGARFAAHDEVAVVESVKAASEVFTPLGGEIVAVNEALADDPSLVNSAAEKDGWFFQIRLAEPGELDGLMTADQYRSFVEGLD